MPHMWIVYLAAVAAGMLLALPAAQALWLPLTHLRFALYHRRNGNGPPALGLIATLSYHWRALIANLVMVWWFVVGLGRNGLRQPTGKVTGSPVLCVHGFLRNGTCMWGLRRALERSGRPTRAVSMGRPFRPIERYTPPLEQALRELVESHPGEAIDVVAHSMGGVILRLVLARHPRLAAAIGQIVTLGSPHRGTAAVLGVSSATGLGAPEYRQLDPDSTFLSELPVFSQSAPRARVVTIATERDYIVYPHQTSHLPGARAIDFSTASHPGLITEKAVIQCVVESLSEESPARSGLTPDGLTPAER